MLCVSLDVCVADGEGGTACDAFVMPALIACGAERVFESETILLASHGADSALCAPSEMFGGNVVDAFAFLHCKEKRKKKWKEENENRAA